MDIYKGLKMTKEEACEFWIEKHFSYIPTELLMKAYEPEEIEILAPDPKEIRCPAFPSHSWVLVPNLPEDEIWIRENAQEIYEKTGLIVYETAELGLYLGVDPDPENLPADFYDEYWLKLYDLRELDWHCEEAEL